MHCFFPLSPLHKQSHLIFTSFAEIYSAFPSNAVIRSDLSLEIDLT